MVPHFRAIGVPNYQPNLAEFLLRKFVHVQNKTVNKILTEEIQLIVSRKLNVEIEKTLLNSIMCPDNQKSIRQRKN